jgi:hypothetical protein
VLREAGEAVEDQAAGDRHVEAGADADHGDLDTGVRGLDVFGGDALGFVAQQDDGWLCGRCQPGESDRVVGELDGEDPPAALALEPDPPVLAGADPVDAATSGQVSRIADAQRVAIVGRVGNREARAGGVAGAEEGSEVGLVGDPERGNDQVAPTAVTAGAARSADVPPSWRASRRGGGPPFQRMEH